jgi:prepilin-type N-terminal cleavage/methylation domain
MDGKNEHGLTLVELMITSAIIALLVAVGIPSLSDYLENRKIRNTTASIVSGLQQARINAVKKNVPTEFTLIHNGWIIQEININTTPPEAINPPVEIHSWVETVATTSLPPSASRITFDNMGRIMNANVRDGSPPLNTVDVQSATPTAAPSLRAEADALQGIRVCAPHLFGTDDPKACRGA